MDLQRLCDTFNKALTDRSLVVEVVYHLPIQRVGGAVISGSSYLHTVRARPRLPGEPLTHLCEAVLEEEP